jgi:UDP-4-amino-4,6-dideoxy-N-acetyl-beta-L-altrosamine transaminase
VDEDDVRAVVDIMRGDWLTTGPAVESFEIAFASHIGVAFAVSFSSGTAALHGAMHAAGAARGGGVISTPLTFAATMNAALYCGATPVFADIAAETLCLDVDEARRAARTVGCVRAVVPVSYAGYPVDISSFRDLASECGAVLIEDACHALGAERGGVSVGREADMTVFSFHPVKHITTAEGGMVVTDSETFAKSLRIFRSHGIVKAPEDFRRPYDGPWDNDMIDLGFNYRLSDVACALGSSQLKRLERFVARRREIADRYRQALAGVDGVLLPPDHPGHSHHLFPVRLDSDRRKDVFKSLRDAGIGVQVHYVPLHLHTYYKEKFGFRAGEFPNAEAFSAGEISLPVYPDMDDSDVEFVARNLTLALGC